VAGIAHRVVPNSPREKVLVMEMKLELVFVPVTDVDRARDFYVDKAGFNLDFDHTVREGLRFVQLTPPGSACSIAFGIGLLDSEPSTIQCLQMVIEDADVAHKELSERGVDVSDVDDQPWGRFVKFTDPDGNGWALQQIIRPNLG
jgi:catechol 2,3-dioxygenase-like lactoylglutathione lyase family enzyme